MAGKYTHARAPLARKYTKLYLEWLSFGILGFCQIDFFLRQSNSFFLQSSLYKNWECNYCCFQFFSFLPPRSLFFSFGVSFVSVHVLLELIGFRNLNFNAFSCKWSWPQISLCCFSTNRLAIYSMLIISKKCMRKNKPAHWLAFGAFCLWSN